MATDYNDGRWHGWNGGECPVHPQTVVEVVKCQGRDAVADNAATADGYIWAEGHTIYPIIAFRVVKEYREPRYVWLADYGSAGLGGPFKSEDEARTFCPNAIRFARFCEVTDKDSRPLPNLEDA